MNEAGKFKMKKELLCILLSINVIIIIACTSVGCGKAPETSTTKAAVTTSAATTTKAQTTPVATTKVQTTPSATIATSPLKETIATPTVTEESISNDPFAKMDKVLKGLNIYYEKKWMFAEGIGAKEGYKYSTTSGTYEVYLYDISSEAYKEAVKNNAMNLSGTLFPATIDNGFALYFYPNVSEKVKNEITTAFFQ
jgi:hypothetical protein